MAGIGFELNKILAGDSYASVFKAYSFAAIIGSGAWIIAIVSLALLGFSFQIFDLLPERNLFFVSISFIYALTLVLTGPLQMVLVRYSADKMFVGEKSQIFPAYLMTMAVGSAVFAVIGAVLFVGFVEGPLLFRLTAAYLVANIAAIWITSIFLTALKSYYSVMAGFAIGSAIAVISSLLLAKSNGVSGAMLGFAFGYTILLLVLAAVVLFELGVSVAVPHGFIDSFKKYWDLALAGFLYNLGIWADKFLFWWFDPSSEQVGAILRASPIYDRVVYFAFLTIVPGMAIFLLRLETDFAVQNERYFQHVLNKGTLSQIRQIQAQLIESLRGGFMLLLKIQGLLTAVLVLTADKFLPFVGLTATQSGIFQISVIGVFLLVIFLAVLTVLHYLDRRREAMYSCLVFAVANTGITAATIIGGERWFGFGFFVAAAAGLFVAVHFLNNHLRQLNYHTFTSQPIYG